MFWVLFLLLAIAAAGFSCGRLCLASVAAARPVPLTDRERSLSCYEAAFLAGGPDRVADLTLVSMHRARRLLLAHTGWATVVDPEGRDDLERSVLTAIGPGGQERIAAIRSGAAAADAVHALAERLAAAGLAVPDAIRSGVGTSVRAVRGATLFIAALAVTALLMPGETGTGRGRWRPGSPSRWSSPSAAWPSPGWRSVPTPAGPRRTASGCSAGSTRRAIRSPRWPCAGSGRWTIPSCAAPWPGAASRIGVNDRGRRGPAALLHPFQSIPF